MDKKRFTEQLANMTTEELNHELWERGLLDFYEDCEVGDKIDAIVRHDEVIEAAMKASKGYKKEPERTLCIIHSPYNEDPELVKLTDDQISFYRFLEEHGYVHDENTFAVITKTAEFFAP